MRRQQVVPQDSAILPGYIPIGIRNNHRNMTKFASTDDPGFVAVCGELRRWIRDVSAAASTHKNAPLSSNEDDGKQPGTASQYGDGNWRLNSFGAATMKNVDGNYYEAKGDQNISTVPTLPREGREALLVILPGRNLTIEQ